MVKVIQADTVMVILNLKVVEEEDQVVLEVMLVQLMLDKVVQVDQV